MAFLKFALMFFEAEVGFVVQLLEFLFIIAFKFTGVMKMSFHFTFSKFRPPFSDPRCTLKGG